MHTAPVHPSEKWFCYLNTSGASISFAFSHTDIRSILRYFEYDVRVTRVEVYGNKKFFTIGNWRVLREMIVGMCLRSLTGCGVMITHTAAVHPSQKLFSILKSSFFA